MTSGNISYGSGYPTQGEYHSRVWSGSDGRYEFVDGVWREKWNNFLLDLKHQSVQLGSTAVAVGGRGSASVLQWPASSELRLQSKLVKAIKTHDFNLAVNVAQGKQTLDLAVDNVRKIGRALMALKQGNFGSAAGILGATPLKRRKRRRPLDISARWLELQYGWLPLLQDTAEAAKAFAASHVQRKSRVSAKVTWTDPNTDWSVAPPHYSYPGTVSVRKRIVYEMAENTELGARSLGLFDPLSVAWELIPYSFVLDWFLPVGTYFENLAILPFLVGRFLSTTTGLYRARMGEVHLDPGLDAGYPAWYTGAKRVEYAVVVQREVLTGLTTQMPSFRPLPDALSPRRLFSAIALFHQRLRS